MSEILLDKTRARQRGFTMIEMLISLTIMSMIMLLLGTGIKLLSSSWDRNILKIETKEAFISMAGILRRDIEGIRRIQIKNNSNSYVFSGTQKEIQFVTKAPSYPSIPGFYQVRYVEQNIKGKRRLVRQQKLYMENRSQGSKRPFKDNVSFFDRELQHSFSYGRILNNKVVWEEEWRRENKLPDLIKLVSTSKSALAVLPLVLRIKVDAEQECISSKGFGCSLRKVVTQKIKKGDTQ